LVNDRRNPGEDHLCPDLAQDVKESNGPKVRWEGELGQVFLYDMSIIFYNYNGPILQKDGNIL
jgi:hypothetical protein